MYGHVFRYDSAPLSQEGNSKFPFAYYLRPLGFSSSLSIAIDIKILKVANRKMCHTWKMIYSLEKYNSITGQSNILSDPRLK